MHRSALSGRRRKRSLERPSGNLGAQLTQAIEQYGKFGKRVVWGTSDEESGKLVVLHS